MHWQWRNWPRVGCSIATCYAAQHTSWLVLGLRDRACRLHFSIPAPLNRAGKPLFLLARDLEAEPLPGPAETGSIGGKGIQGSILASLLAIIHLLTQSAWEGCIPF
jgi:hypothetical protein